MVAFRQQQLEEDEATSADSTPLLEPSQGNATDTAQQHSGVSHMSDDDQRITLLDAVMYRPRALLEANALQQGSNCQETNYSMGRSNEDEEHGGVTLEQPENPFFLPRSNGPSMTHGPQSLSFTESWPLNNMRRFTPHSNHSCAQERRNFLLNVIESALQVVDGSEDDDGELFTPTTNRSYSNFTIVTELHEQATSVEGLFSSAQNIGEDDTSRSHRPATGPAQ